LIREIFFSTRNFEAAERRSNYDAPPEQENLQMTFRSKLPTLGMAVFAIIAALMLPTLSFAGQGRGHGKSHKQEKKIIKQNKKNDKQNKKDDKFNNGHDARDGRRDGRGPTRDRRDDDDRYDDRYDRDRDDDYGDYNDDRTGVRERAQRIGYDEGYRAGQIDRANGERADFRDESVYQEATAGYQSQQGALEYYRQQFRAAFSRGYQDGYRNRDSNTRGGFGGILGDIIGRP
jgi:hypothetical protein